MRSWKFALAVVTMMTTVGLTGCGDSNDSDPAGPEITFFGLTRADDSLVEANSETSAGVPIFVRPETVPNAASGFSLVIEGKPGSSNSPVGTASYVDVLDDLPDLQVVVSRPLGNGSPTVCDDPVAAPGGVPAVDPASFDATDVDVIKATNDLGCRFVDGAGVTMARTNPGDSCVSYESGDFAFVDDDTTTQFCGFINVPLAFPKGETIVTARLRDAAGNFGPEKQIVVRVQ